MARVKQFEILANGVYYNGSAFAGWVKFLAAGTSDTKNAYTDTSKSSSFTKKQLSTGAPTTAFGDGLYKLEFYTEDPDNDGATATFTVDYYEAEGNVGDTTVVSSSPHNSDSDDHVLILTTSATINLDYAANYRHPISIFILGTGVTLTLTSTYSEYINGVSSKKYYAPYTWFFVVPDADNDRWLCFDSRHRNQIHDADGDETLTVEDDSQKTILLNDNSAAVTLTVPDAKGDGAQLLFKVGTVNTNGYVIQAPDADNIFQGHVLAIDTGATPDAVFPWMTASDSDTITLNGTTTGGLKIGDWVLLEDIASGVWAVTGIVTTSGTTATPFSAAVS